MGDWYLDRNGEWDYDKDAPVADPTVTGMFPAVQSREDEPDHADLEPVEPEEFPRFDGVTSLMIRSIGAPE